jgi:Reverse transcriptase (RNA-dependent DNA polymerase)
MDVSTHHVFNSPSVKFDEYLFPGLPSKSPNPNLFPYRSVKPIDTTVSLEKAGDNTANIPVETSDSPLSPTLHSPPRKRSRTRLDLHETSNHSAMNIHDNSNNSRLGAELRTDSRLGAELRTDSRLGRALKADSGRLGTELRTTSRLGVGLKAGEDLLGAELRASTMQSTSPLGAELRASDTQNTRQSGAEPTQEPHPLRSDAEPHNRNRNFVIEIPPLKRPSLLTTLTECSNSGSIVNLASGLTFFDLTGDEPPVDKPSEATPSSFLRNKLTLDPPQLILTTSSSHERKGFSGNTGSRARIRVDMNGDPLDFRSAMEQAYSNWHPAVLTEVESLIKTDCFTITFLPPGKTAIGCKWVFKRKTESAPIEDQGADNSTKPSSSQIRTRYKARVVAKGFEQEYGVDFWDTFSPTPRITTFRMLIALIPFFKWHTHQLDISTAFLNAKLDTEVYLKTPEGMEDLVESFFAS